MTFPASTDPPRSVVIIHLRLRSPSFLCWVVVRRGRGSRGKVIEKVAVGRTHFVVPPFLVTGRLPGAHPRFEHTPFVIHLQTQLSSCDEEEVSSAT